MILSERSGLLTATSKPPRFHVRVPTVRPRQACRGLIFALAVGSMGCLLLAGIIGLHSEAPPREGSDLATTECCFLAANTTSAASICATCSSFEHTGDWCDQSLAVCIGRCHRNRHTINCDALCVCSPNLHQFACLACRLWGGRNVLCGAIVDSN